MPKIEIDEKTLIKVKSQLGVYSQLRQPLKSNKDFEKNLREMVTVLIEKAFREWARKHRGITVKLENESWEQFNKILQKYL